MENELRAARDGTVSEVHARKGRRWRPARCWPSSVPCNEVPSRVRGNRAVRYVSFALHPRRGDARGRDRRHADDRSRAACAASRSARARKRSSGRCTSAGSASTCSPANSVVDDLRIDGLHPGDRPFFTAKRLDVALDWLPALAPPPRVLVTSVEMTDWQMLVEKWDGGHNFPKFTRDEPDAGRAAAVHDDAAVSARVARAVHLRGPRGALEHRVPESGHQYRQRAAAITARRRSPAGQ